jgi:hypothetical protein
MEMSILYRIQEPASSQVTPLVVAWEEVEVLLCPFLVGGVVAEVPAWCDAVCDAGGAESDVNKSSCVM